MEGQDFSFAHFMKLKQWKSQTHPGTDVVVRESWILIWSSDHQFQCICCSFETPDLSLKICSSQKLEVQTRSLGELASITTSAVILKYDFEKAFSWLSHGALGTTFSNAYFGCSIQKNLWVNRPYVVPIFVYFNLYIFRVHLKDMRFPLNW